MEKEINSNAVSELNEASLEQVTGGRIVIKSVPVIGGADAMAAPDKAIVQDFRPLPPMIGAKNDINRKPDIADIDGL